jgi:hypothetical protein
VGSFQDERERRRKWAREVLDRLGFGMARDESGFFRPARLPQPRPNVSRQPRQPAEDQLELNFETE